MITIVEARLYYEGADAVHDFDHVLRVLALAERIGQAEGADLEVVRAAALLHDGGREQAETDGLDHAAFAADRAREILARWPSEKVEAVAHAIADATGVWVKELPITPEKILRALKEKVNESNRTAS